MGFLPHCKWYKVSRSVKKRGLQKKLLSGLFPKYPLVICYIAIENGPVEIVDLPSYKIVIFHSFPMKNCDFP